MMLSLAGLWQLSPLTDLTIPQDDITFPAALSQILPSYLSETDIAKQEWHLMHDIDLDEAMLAHPAIELVLGGIGHFAEVRVNGVAVFDCDGRHREYKKEIRDYLHLGRNRFEILFLDAEDQDWLVDDPDASQALCMLGSDPLQADERMGIWQAPYLQFIAHVRLDQISTEQVWHHGGGCEFLVHLYYTTYKPGLVSAAVKFNGMTYQIPIDVRSDHALALFQVDAPVYVDVAKPVNDDWYTLTVTLDGQHQQLNIGLSKNLCVTHYPL